MPEMMLSKLWLYLNPRSIDNRSERQPRCTVGSSSHGAAEKTTEGTDRDACASDVHRPIDTTMDGADDLQLDSAAIRERAVHMCKKALGLEGVLTLEAINNHGGFDAYLSWLKDAELMFKRSLRSKEETLGLEHPSTLDTANNLADVYAAQGCLGDAEATYERVLRGKAKTFGPEHASTLYTGNKLGNIYVTRGRLSDAATMYERVLRATGVASLTHIDA